MLRSQNGSQYFNNNDHVTVISCIRTDLHYSSIMPLQLQFVLRMKGLVNSINALERGKRLKTQKSLRRFMKSEKETTVSVAHSPLKSGCERKGRNRTVARRGSRVKLMFFSRGREPCMFEGKRKECADSEFKVNKDFYLHTP